MVENFFRGGNAPPCPPLDPPLVKVIIIVSVLVIVREFYSNYSYSTSDQTWVQVHLYLYLSTISTYLA